MCTAACVPKALRIGFVLQPLKSRLAYYRSQNHTTYAPGIDQGDALQDLAFRTLLYRYFFFGWLYKDVSRGSLLERSAAW
jgi:hypothetical protein